jgi:hypothetical protein
MREYVTGRDVARALAGAAMIAALGGAASRFAPGLATGVVAAGLFFGLALLVVAHARRIEARLTELEGDVSQIEPIVALSRLIGARALPPMREYAIAPDFALVLYELVLDLAPRVILETGSGVSTLVCAYALEKRGGEGRVLALDHDADYAAKTRASLEQHGLSHRATVVHAPLQATQIGGRSYTWYSQDALADVGPIDLVVDDGPPKYVGPMARYASLPTLAPRMRDAAPFLLDYVGAEERETVARWCAELPYEVKWLPTRKGNAILRRTRAAVVKRGPASPPFPPE